MLMEIPMKWHKEDLKAKSDLIYKRRAGLEA